MHRDNTTLHEKTAQVSFGAAVAQLLSDRMRPGQRVYTLGIPDRFFTHNSQGALRDEAGLSPEAIVATVKRVMTEQPAGH